MKNYFIALILLLVGCAVPHSGHDTGNPSGDAVTYVENHHKTKAAAFSAAAAWSSSHYKGGKDILQLVDKDSGTIIVKGVYRWTKPIDSFGLHFHEGSIAYTLTMKITDTTVEMDFRSGEIYGDAEYEPKDLMPQVLPYYQSIRKDIMNAISEK